MCLPPRAKPGARSSTRRARATGQTRSRWLLVIAELRGKRGVALGSRHVEILDVETEDRDGLVHVALKGELDLSTVAKVQDELRRVEEGEPPVVALRLRDTAVTLCDRSIEKATTRRYDGSLPISVMSVPWSVVIVRGPEPVQRVFAITRLEERLEMVDDASAVS